MIILKSERDLEAMRPACAVAGTVLEEVAAFVQPGVTTKDVDEFAASRIKHYGAKSAFLGYRKYPCQICISVNDLVIHRNTYLTRILAISQKRALRAIMLDPRSRKLVHILRRHSGLNKSGNLFKDGASHRAGWPHRFQVPLTLQNDHQNRPRSRPFFRKPS